MDGMSAPTDPQSTASTVTTDSPFLTSALMLARHGWKVFPCVPGTKEPATTNGFHDASSDPDVIRRWWAETPYNIGLCLDGSGVCVIDTDPAGADEPAGAPDGEQNLQTLAVEHGDFLGMPPTLSVRSPRGGLHRYYIGNIPGSTGKRGGLVPHVDTKGIGGYVLAVPSVTENGTYRYEGGEYFPDREKMAPVPPWVLPAIMAKKVRPKAASTVDLDLPVNITRAVDFLSRQHKLVDGDGSDADAFVLSCRLRELGISDDYALTMLCRWQPEFDEAWWETKVANGYHYARNGAACHAAQPAAVAFREGLAQLEAEQEAVAAKLKAQREAVAALAEGMEPGPTRDGLRAFLAASTANVDLPGLPDDPDDDEDDEGEGADKFDAIPLNFYDNTPPPTYWDPEYKLFPKIVGGSRILIAGGYSSHKTNFALFQCVNALREHPTARVIYCAGEAHVELLQQRIPAICKALKISRQELVGRLVVMKACPTLTDPCDVARLLSTQDAFARGADGDLIVIIDTLAEALTGQDENSTAVGTLAMRQAGRIKRRWQCLVALVHHFGKDASKGSRGNSAFPAGADAVLELTYDRTAATVKVWVDKMRSGKDKREVVLGTVIVDLNANGTGGGDLGTMTVIPLTPEARQAAVAKVAKAERNPHVAFIRAVLRDAGAVDEDHSLSRDHLAASLAATGMPPDAVGDGHSKRAIAARADWAKRLPTVKAQWKAKLHDGAKIGTEAKPRRAAFGELFRRLSWPLDEQDHPLEDRWFVAPIAAGDEA